MDCEPELIDISKVCDMHLPENSNVQVVLIRTVLNSFDWTAHHMLSVYKDHPLINGDYYLYLLDTSIVEKDFWSKTLDQLPRKGFS
jgi:hypothetical protein